MAHMLTTPGISVTRHRWSQEAGFDALTVPDAARPMKEIEADCERVSALITDIDLGDKQSSGAIARHARQLNPALRVI